MICGTDFKFESFLFLEGKHCNTTELCRVLAAAMVPSGKFYF